MKFVEVEDQRTSSPQFVKDVELGDIFTFDLKDSKTRRLLAPLQRRFPERPLKGEKFLRLKTGVVDLRYDAFMSDKVVVSGEFMGVRLSAVSKVDKVWKPRTVELERIK